MEAVYTALIALASAVIVKVLDWVLARKAEKKGAIAQLSKKVDSISDRLNTHIAEDQESKAISARHRILMADDEILHGVRHSKEWFESTLIDITNYNNYCREHPTFPNAITLSAVANIQRVYEKCKEENSFL